MVINLGPELEAALNEVARQKGVAPEELAVKALQERIRALAVLLPRDEWKRRPSRSSEGLRRFFIELGREQRRNIRLVAYLIDTTILVRLANTADTDYAVAAWAVRELHRRGEILHLNPQALVKFRSVATRPVAVNGLGLSTVDTEVQAATFEARFPLLPDTPDIYPAWKALVGAVGVIGKQVHDARLVAVCHAHGITHLLTFNVSHFLRMAGFGPGIVVVDPANV